MRGRKRIFIEEAVQEEFLHKEVWRVVERQLAHAERNERGAMYDHLVAMAFAALSLEGYANFLLAKIAPDLWTG